MNISEINSDTKPSFTILVADDDPDDRFLLGLAFEELQGVGELHFVEDGEQLINYLYRQGEYTDPVLSPQAELIFLDLNMPKKNGRQALAEIKADTTPNENSCHCMELLQLGGRYCLLSRGGGRFLLH